MKKIHSSWGFLTNHNEDRQRKIVTTVSNQMLKSILPKKTQELNQFQEFRVLFLHKRNLQKKEIKIQSDSMFLPFIPTFFIYS